jgi:hypothetical protein
MGKRKKVAGQYYYIKKEKDFTKEAHLGKEKLGPIQPLLLAFAFAFAFALHLSLSGQRK